MKKLLVGLVVLGALALGFWMVAADLVDRALNRTGPFTGAKASDRARALAKTLRIVDATPPMNPAKSSSTTR